jgi:hypothetical protein
MTDDFMGLGYREDDASGPNSQHVTTVQLVRTRRVWIIDDVVPRSLKKARCMKVIRVGGDERSTPGGKPHPVLRDNFFWYQSIASHKPNDAPASPQNFDLYFLIQAMISRDLLLHHGTELGR